MNRETVDRWCELGILALVLAILVLGPLAWGAVRPLELAGIQGLALLVGVLWVVRLWLSSRPQILWPPVCWAVLAFAGYAVGRYFTADIEYVARQELLAVLTYAFLFFAILNNLHRQESTQIISFTLLTLGMLISFYAIYQFATGSDYVWNVIKPYPRRGSGTYICPNHLGGFLELLLPVGLAYTLTGRLKPLSRILIGYTSLVIAAGIAVTLSRGSWLATGCALAAFFLVLLFRPRYRLQAVLLLGILLVAGLAFFPRNVFVRTRVQQTVAEQSRMDTQSRLALWETALRIWKDHPWWGVGPSHFDARFRNYRPEGVQMNAARVHNDYLNTLVDYGLVGAVVVASAWALLAWGIVKTRRAVRLSSGDLGGKSGSNKFAFVYGAALGLFALLVHSFFDFNFHIPANAILAVTWMALVASFVRFATEQYWFRLRLWSKAAATLVLAGGMVPVTPFVYRQASEFVQLERANRLPAYSRDQIQALERAFASEPKNPQTAYAIAEAYRMQSQEGGDYYQGQEGMDYRGLAQKAIQWFERSRQLNPWDSRTYCGIGWCLDWLDRPQEATPYFARAEELDPNNYYNLNAIGLHYVQIGNYAAAKPWFERSIRLKWQPEENPARAHLALVTARMQEAATNEFRLKMYLPSH
jgi:O-antigen ligase